jgi:chemotaxis protein MotB
MAIRRRHEEEHENHERWLVSYADFITLLFAFFVVMYAISTLNEGKYRVLSDALMAAFRHDRVVTAQTTGIAPMNRTTAAPLPPRPGPKVVDPLRREQERRLLDLASKIKEALAPLVKTGQVRLTQLPRGIAVEINASVLFAPAQAALQPDSVAALQAVAQVLATTPDPVQVEGHTDNLPIASTQFPSNWELASARASSVVRLFVASGVEASRLTASGYADNRPVESNDTPEGRARNRRVTLMIIAAPATDVDAASGVGKGGTDRASNGSGSGSGRGRGA